MLAFLASQSDYIYFFYGLAFILLAAMAYPLELSDGTRMPWKWLALFGIAHGINEWLDTMVLSLGGALSLVVVKFILMPVSFFFLLEFGRAGTAAMGKRAPGRWIAPALLALAVFDSFIGSAGMDVYLRFILGLSGGLWAAWALFLYRRRHYPKSRPLALAVLAMAFYALAAGIFSLEASAFPAVVFDQDAFLAVTGLPIQLLRGLLVVILSLAIWRHAETAFSEPAAPEIGRPNLRILLVVLFVFVFIAGWVATQRAGRSRDMEERSHILEMVEAGAATIDEQHVTALTGTEKDLATPLYARLKEQLKELRQADSDIRSCYLLRKTGAKTIFLADSEPVGSTYTPRPGTPYRADSPEIETVFETGRALSEGPLSDQRGIWITARAPVLSLNGRIVAVLNADVDARNWYRKIEEARSDVILVTMLLSFLIFLSYATLWRTMEARKAIARIAGEQSLLLNTIDTQVWYLTDEQTYGAVNNSHAVFSGKLKNSLERRNLRDILPEDEAQAVIASNRVPFAERRQIHTEEWRKDARGVRHLLRITKTPKITPSGAVEYVVCSAEDITELKEAQESLRAMNEKLERKVLERTKDLGETTKSLEQQKEILQMVIDNIPVMLVFYDSTGKARLINREFERLTGWSLQDVGNMMRSLAVRPSAPDGVGGIPVPPKDSGTAWRDIDLSTRSGKLLQSSWVDVRLSDGSVIGIGIDVTERRKMEQELLRLGTAIEQAGEGILLFSPEGVIEYANPAYEGLSGYSRHEFLGKAITVLGTDVSDSYQRIFEKVKIEGRTWTGRQTRKRRNGENLEVSLSVAPVRDANGTIINFISILLDVTREIELQDRLSQTQKMEALGTLAGGIAHDLKNILTPILINTELALEDMGADHPAYPVIEEVLRAARIGADLVKQILTFSRRAPREKIPLNVSEIVGETLAFLRSSLPPEIEIHRRFSGNAVMALVDPTQIKQVLINLGMNAGHAMNQEGGVLDIELDGICLDEKTTERISPDLAPGAYIQITVQDTGKGMDEKTMEHIFEPFFTTKPKGEGTGMGLAVVHGIVRDHKGAVTVRSEPGRGSVFTVYLPMLQEDAACRTG